MGKTNSKKKKKSIPQELESSMVIITIMVVLLFGVFFGIGYAAGGCSVVNYVKEINNNSHSGELMELKR